MLKRWLKTIPIIKQLHQNRLLKAELLHSQRQTSIAIKTLTQAYLNNVELALNSESRKELLVATLTSFGERINTVHQTIISLLNQSYRPDKLILWLAEDEFSERNLPESLTMLKQFGLEIAFCKDLKSYKKLIPSLKQFSQSLLVTFDDDVVYPQDQVERLIKAHQSYPNAIVCHRAHRILKDRKGNILAYQQWQYDVAEPLPAYDLVPIGIGGILYPVDCFDDEVGNVALFSALCPTTDDLWFKVMSLKAKRKVKVVDEPIPYREYLQIPQMNHPSLWEINMTQNDVQLQKLLSHYPTLTFWP